MTPVGGTARHRWKMASGVNPLVQFLRRRIGRRKKSTFA